jgi:hypothetical protein
MGRVALDGTKLEANASKHKAMSYGWLVDKEEQLEAEIAALEARPRPCWPTRRPLTPLTPPRTRRSVSTARTLPAELDRREKRLAKLQAARAQIEAEAQKAREHTKGIERRRQERAAFGDGAGRHRRRTACCRESPSQSQGAGQPHGAGGSAGPVRSGSAHDVPWPDFRSNR